MNAVILEIEGMNRGGCAATIQAMLERNPGAREVSGSSPAAPLDEVRWRA